MGTRVGFVILSPLSLFIAANNVVARLPDLAFQAINEALGRPPLMLMDLRPFGPPMAIVRSHEVAEQVSKAYKQFPYSLPKMPQVYGHMVHVTGPTSILGADVCRSSMYCVPLRPPFFVPRGFITLS